MSRMALIDKLQRTLGLDPQSIGEITLHHAIDEACAEMQARDAGDLYARVCHSPADWQRFVDCMVVPETWLFRVPEQFDDLLRHARALPADRRPLRLLSLPCASGEEAWSIAASMVNGGFAVSEFDVTGIDVSARAVAQARRAQYRDTALRGRAIEAGLEWLDGYLCPVSMLRRSVRFRCGNILAADLFAPGEQFDVVFCRNLLIYLDADARQKALDRLLGVLAEDGLLIAGQAELLSAMDPRLVPAPGLGPLSFVRAQGKRDAARTPSVLPAPTRRQAPSPAPPRSPPVPQPAGESAGHLLQRAQQAADTGALGEARALCQSLLSKDAELAPAWFLLGMIEAAGGAFDAADQAFARASYLDRGHEDALLHRAALAERRGRMAEAAQLRSRLQRVRSAGGAP